MLFTWITYVVVSIGDLLTDGQNWWTDGQNWWSDVVNED